MDVQTKTGLIANRLRKEILCGAFSDGHLPRERELAVKLQVSRVTIRRALAILEKEQLISRRRRNGTTVQDGPANPKQKNGTIGLFCQMQGHFYAEFYHLLLAELIRNGFSVQDIDTSGLEKLKGKRSALTRAAEHLLHEDLAGVVIDGYLHTAIPFIEEFKRKHPIFINFYDSNLISESTGVWFNYEKVGYLAGKHLMDCGCRHPFLIPNPVRFHVRFTPEAYARHKDKKIINGFSKALSEAGLEPELYIMDPYCGMDRLRRPSDFMWKILSTAGLRPDGIFAASDSIIAHFLKETEEYGFKLPLDFPLIGCYNTPWSRGDASRQFSSIDLNPELTAKTIVEQLRLPFKKRQDVYIEPKLIVRRSANKIH